MLAASACSVHSATSPPSTFAFAALRLLTFCKEIKIKIFCGKQIAHVLQISKEIKIADKVRIKDP